MIDKFLTNLEKAIDQLIEKVRSWFVVKDVKKSHKSVKK